MNRRLLKTIRQESTRLTVPPGFGLFGAFHFGFTVIAPLCGTKLEPCDPPHPTTDARATQRKSAERPKYPRPIPLLLAP